MGRKSQEAHCVDGDIEDSENSSDEEAYSMFTVKDPTTDPIFKEVHMNSVPINMELDTGASLSVITHSTYQEIKDSSYIEPLQPTTVRLRTYTGETIRVLGQVPVKVRYGQTDYQLTVLVVEGKGPNLMGRDWLRKLKVTLEGIHSTEQSSVLGEILKKHSRVSLTSLAVYKGLKSICILIAKLAPTFLGPALYL